MKCPNCGCEFEEGIFCPECGTRVDETITEVAEESIGAQAEETIPVDHELEIERQKTEQARIEKERLEKEVELNNQKIEMEKIAAEKERAEQERQEKERQEKEKADREAEEKRKQAEEEKKRQKAEKVRLKEEKKQENEGRPMAILSLIFGVISLVTFGAFFIPEILGIIFAFFGRKQGKMRGLAKAGLICSVISILIVLLVLVYAYLTHAH